MANVGQIRGKIQVEFPTPWLAQSTQWPGRPPVAREDAICRGSYQQGAAANHKTTLKGPKRSLPHVFLTRPCRCAHPPRRNACPQFDADSGDVGMAKCDMHAGGSPARRRPTRRRPQAPPQHQKAPATPLHRRCVATLACPHRPGSAAPPAAPGGREMRTTVLHRASRGMYCRAVSQHTHTQTHHVHTNTHERTHAHTDKRMHRHTDARTNAHALHERTHAHKHAREQARTHARSNARTNA